MKIAMICLTALCSTMIIAAVIAGVATGHPDAAQGMIDGAASLFVLGGITIYLLGSN